MGACLVWLVLGVAGAAVQLDLDCAAPERARALIEYARLSEVEQIGAPTCNYVWVADGPLSAAYRGLRRSWANSPITPLRKVSTQTTKISPCTIVTQAPIWAR